VRPSLHRAEPARYTARVAIFDPHSHADDAEPFIRSIDLDLRVDFDTRTLSGTARLTLVRPALGRLTLDCRGLAITDVRDAAGNPVEARIEKGDPIRGEKLVLDLQGVIAEITYSTAPEALALQWLSPAQTAGKQHPFVFTQCQPIHARTLMPCQDSPAVRITYTARLDIPAHLTAVMAAGTGARSVGPHEKRAIARFEMAQPIPPYLFAFAVGDLVSIQIGPRSQVWAEPSVVEKAAYEFADTDKMLTVAEGMFGKYDWERYDLLVMPPSFPYGGMENPRLTFLTPTLIAGDRSLAAVVGHELAHSWTGNLVTNATMEHFWLNEGFTTFAERRILGAIEGDVQVSLHEALGRRGMISDMARFPADSPFTRLRTPLEGVDPDEVYSRIPYEKGYLFLRRIEEAVGTEAFDEFLKTYIQTFRFQSITTDQFLQLIDVALPEAKKKVDFGLWIDGPGLPADAPSQPSPALERVEAAAALFARGELPGEAIAKAWSATEWQVYLSLIARPAPHDRLAEMEKRFALSSSGNAEILAGWLAVCARSGYAPAFPTIRKMLLSVGRMKYLRPIYSALAQAGGDAATLAKSTFTEGAATYHPIARGVIQGVLDSPPKNPEMV